MIKSFFNLTKKYSKEEKIFYEKLKVFLSFKPKNLKYYKIAFRHSSASINLGKTSKKLNNERLEFVGDAVINLVIADILFKYRPELEEGNLSLYRSKIVSRKNLNQIAKRIKLEDFIIANKHGNTPINNIGGNALEALFGAIYYDKGYKYCEKFAKDVLLNHRILNQIEGESEDHKSQILNFAQKNRLELTFSTFENLEANEKIQHFLCELLVNGNYLTSGKGWSKKEAEQNCAKNAIEIDKKTIFKIAKNKN